MVNICKANVRDFANPGVPFLDGEASRAWGALLHRLACTGMVTDGNNGLRAGTGADVRPRVLDLGHGLPSDRSPQLAGCVSRMIP